MRAVLLSIFLAALVSLVAIPPLASALTFNRPLGYGSSGTDVSVLQQYLKDQGYFHYPDITGYFGPYTWRALAAFQWDNKLESVGYLGPKTELALNKLLDQSLASLATSTSAASTTTTAPPTLPFYPVPGMVPGNGYSPGFGAGGGGPPAPAPVPTPPPAPAPYVAQAVHFNSATPYLMRRSLDGVNNTPKGTVSLWVKSDYEVFMFGNTNAVQFFSSTMGGLFFQVTGALDIFWGMSATLNNDWRNAPGQFIDQFGFYGGGAATPGSWEHWIESWDLTDTNNPVRFIARNGTLVSVTDHTGQFTPGVDLSVDWTNGVFSLPANPGVLSDFSSSAFDVADVYIAPGQFVDLSVQSNLDKFIKNGKPVYLGLHGELPTGTAPAVYFSGDASSFPKNAGIGGEFSVCTIQLLPGRNGVGAMSVPGATTGTVVQSVFSENLFEDVSNEFEKTVSANGQLQQISATDYSADILSVALVNGTLTDASSSPSN